MNIVLTGNNRATRDAYVPPPSLKEDGSNYRWRMFFDGNSAIADTDDLAELVNLLFPGYTELEDEDERLTARMRIAHGVQRQLRVSILANITQEEEEALTDEERRLLYWSETIDPTAPEGAEGELWMWNSDIPLVLLDYWYRPFSSYLPPLSKHGDFADPPNIIWLRVGNDRALLESLTRVGFVTFGRPRAVNHVPKRLRDRAEAEARAAAEAAAPSDAEAANA